MKHLTLIRGAKQTGKTRVAQVLTSLHGDRAHTITARELKMANKDWLVVKYTTSDCIFKNDVNVLLIDDLETDERNYLSALLQYLPDHITRVICTYSTDDGPITIEHAEFN